jgi:hypothetical protein
MDTLPLRQWEVVGERRADVLAGHACSAFPARRPRLPSRGRPDTSTLEDLSTQEKTLSRSDTRYK